MKLLLVTMILLFFMVLQPIDQAGAVKQVYHYGKLWSEFDGYDQVWLKRPDVKQVCIDSHEDLSKVGMPDLAYCGLIPK